jgi:Rod binding domain-containing protein
MASNLTPDTNLALLQASQGDVGAVAKSAKSYKDLAKVEEAAKEFEAVFVAEMMKPMFEGIATDGAFGGGKGEEVFRGMLIQEYGKILSQTGNIGIADSVKEEMIRMQERADNKALATTTIDIGTTE